MSATICCKGSVCRSVETATLGVSKKTRSVTAVWSDDSGDHYRTAFVQTGIDMSTFASNAVILFEHGAHPVRATLPIANAIEWGVEKHKGRLALIGTSRFWEDEFADARFEDYASGRLKGWSVRSLPISQRAPTPAERRARADWADLEVVYEETRLLEVSAVTLPGNKNTLTLSVERSLATAPTQPHIDVAAYRRQLDQEYAARRRRILDRLPALVGQAINEAMAERAAESQGIRLRKLGDEWIITRDGGEILRTRDRTEAEAMIVTLGRRP